MFGQIRSIGHNAQGPHGSNAQGPHGSNSQGPHGRRYRFNSMQVKREFIIGNTTHKIVNNNRVGIGKYFRYHHLNTSLAEFSKNIKH